MTKNELIDLIQKMENAPSCCKELKAAGKAYLDAAGSEKEQAAAQAFWKELKEDVCSIENFIEFTASEKASQVFGKETSEKMHSAAQEAKGKGIRYCLCDACTAGGKILDDPSALGVRA